MIPYGRQNITQEDVDGVVEVLNSDFLTQGEVVGVFERNVAEYVGTSHAVAVNSGTSALHLACLALGLGEGDWLWTTPITFVASANCALYCGAQVDFADIDPTNWNISVDALRAKLDQARDDGKLPKIVVAVHLCGLSCDMEAIHSLSEEYGFSIVEDACHALGGSYHNKPVGSCGYSDIAVFSFHPVKTMTTGEGGMAVTNQATLAEKMMLLRSHGITREPEMMTHEPDGLWYYQQIELGFNYRMTEMQAALGVTQLRRLGQFIERRHQLAEQYDVLLADLPLQLPHHTDEASYSALHLYVVRVTGLSQNEHKQLFQFLRERGIGVNLHYIPVHTQPYYAQFGFSWGDFPNAENYYCQAISLPMFPDLTDEQQQYVADTLKEALR